MLKDLNELVVPMIDTSDEERLTKAMRKVKLGEARERAKAVRDQIDPTDLENELHEHMEKIVIELDHIVDILALCALKTKDECEDEIVSRRKASPVFPEFLFNPEYRTFSLYWRRILKLTPGVNGEKGTLKSERLPITQKPTKDEEGGSYPKTIFSAAQPTLRQALSETEDGFRRLRTMMQAVSQMRRTVGVVDRHATKYFDEAIVYETKPRRTSSKPSEFPVAESECVTH